jgi:haloalkane dehalogenase
VQGIAYMESIVAPLEWSDLSEEMRPAFEAMRSPAGDAMVLQENFMVEQILFGTIRGQSPMSLKRNIADPS